MLTTPTPTQPGHRVVIVTSGAVGAGAARLGLATRPTDLAAKQALAAVGQVHLMRHYDDFFAALRLTAAQVLLTLDNLAVRSQYLTAASTFEAIFEAGVVPIVNENDTVAVQELRIGDNDTLAAQVATLVHADWLFLLTDVDALYTANPAADPTAAPVREVHDVAALASAVSTGGAVGGTEFSTGGMATKLTAARIATAAGCSTAVVHGAAPSRVARVIAGDATAGTVFHATPTPTRGRKRWITSVPVKGELALDAGAAAAVRRRGKSLFAAGVARVSGVFGPLDAVSLNDGETGAELARGLINYGSEDVAKLLADAARHRAGGSGAGGSSGDGGGLHAHASPADVLGWPGPDELVHRDNIALMAPRSTTPTPVVCGTPPGTGGVLTAEDEDGAPPLRVASARPVRLPPSLAATATAVRTTSPPCPPVADGPEERLAHLRERDAALAAATTTATGGAADRRVSFDLTSLDGALEAAYAVAAVERGADGVGVGVGAARGEEDVTDEGWLPK